MGLSHNSYSVKKEHYMIFSHPDPQPVFQGLSPMFKKYLLAEQCFIEMCALDIHIVA